jgi:hypothetical protein
MKYFERGARNETSGTSALAASLQRKDLVKRQI